MMDNIKSQFPIFEHHPKLSYLDNSATNQRPQRVIDAITEYYTEYNSNVHRGLYPLSELATERYEKARKQVAQLINAEPDEVIFVSSATDALNLLAGALVSSELTPENPVVVTTELEHHSNIIPWQQNPAVKSLEFLPVNEDYQIDTSALAELPKPDVVSFASVSNVTGSIVDTKKFVEQIRKINPNALVIADAAQAAGHMPLDVKDLDLDFMVLAGHKMYGPTGIGVLYIRRELLDKVPPLRFGGGMIRKVTKQESTWCVAPEKFEAGTPPIAQAIGLGAAVEFIQEVGPDVIRKHEQEIAVYAYEQLTKLPGIQVFHPSDPENHAATFSFTLEQAHSHDVAHILGNQHVAVRAGHHCTQILHREIMEVPASTRASLAVYNNQEDIDKLIVALKSVIKTFSK